MLNGPFDYLAQRLGVQSSFSRAQRNVFGAYFRFRIKSSLGHQVVENGNVENIRRASE